ncbi:MAG: GC-type dockerin domain-anchored protein [Phycisphaerales bacterium JB052]
MYRKTTALSCLAACATLALAGGPVAYAPNSLNTNADDSDDLIMFDPHNPSGYTVIGSMDVENIGFGGMDFDADGNLWAYASFYKSTGGAASGLYRVDMQTGKATPQGFNLQSLQDIAFNPADGKMYGINTRQASMTTLYEIDLVSGAATPIDLFSGLQTPHIINGFAFDSQGNMYLQDHNSDMIYVTDDVSNPLTSLITLPQDNNYSQGMTIDWSRDDTGYHAAVGQGVFPNYFSQVNTFSIDGSTYTLGDSFGPNDQEGLPPVQPGDIALPPADQCAADLTGDGQLNFFDVSAFLSAFASQDPVADFTGDGSYDFFDVSAFLSAFSSGCP